MTDLHHLDAAAALRAFRALELSPLELLDALAARTAAVEGDRERGVNAFTATRWDTARAEARAAGDAYARAARTGEALPPLLGVAVATKEKHGIAGESLEQGLLSHRGRTARADHPVVERVLAGGGIIHARTASPEFSCATVTHSPLWGTTRNPWNLHRSPGGSSGGAGAALAAGTTTLAPASDIAGSTRVPAGFTATVGYKAPFGRIPGLPPLAADWYRGDGPMARTVADTALLAGVLSGAHPIDHGSWGGPGDPFDGVPGAAGGARGLRVAVSVELGDHPVHPDVAAAVRSVARALADAGARVVEVALPWTVEQIHRTTFAHFGHLLASAIAAETAGAEDWLAPYTRAFVRTALAAAARDDLLTSLTMDARVQAELAAATAGVDVLLCPTSGVTSLPAEGQFLDGLDVAGRHLEHYWQGHLTSPFNVANRCPVLSVPAGIAGDGVPIGVQLVGHPGDEATVFRAGAAVEALHPLLAPWPEPVLVSAATPDAQGR